VRPIVTSDNHYFHEKLWTDYGRPKGFEDLIWKNLLDTLRLGDLIINLGDFALGGSAKVQEAHDRFVKPLNDLGYKQWLLLGNHDHKPMSYYLDNGWDFVAKSFTAKFYGLNIRFSHKAGEHNVDLNIHGHWHDDDHRRTEPDQLPFVGSQRHRLVAMEFTGYRPVILEHFVSDLIQEKARKKNEARSAIRLAEMS
jgi:calcineurin-like phosphoesterase family protein